MLCKGNNYCGRFTPCLVVCLILLHGIKTQRLILPATHIADTGPFWIRPVACVLHPALDTDQQTMPKENFNNLQADLEVTFLECFPGFKICILETASGKSAFKNQIAFCLYYGICILCAVSICYITIQITISFEGFVVVVVRIHIYLCLVMSYILLFLQFLSKYSAGSSIKISFSPTDLSVLMH